MIRLAAVKPSASSAKTRRFRSTSSLSAVTVLQVMNPHAKQQRDLAPKTPISGSVADLRKMTMVELQEVLQKLNVPDEEINDLKRWDRVVRPLPCTNAALSCS